jgi:predicted esterase
VRQHHLTISRNVRYATLGEVGDGLRQVWFVCHGYGQLAHRFLRSFSALDDGSRLVVAPEGLSRYYVDHAERIVGASWMTAEDRLTDIADYVAYLDHLHDVVLVGVAKDSIRLYVLGFSQGTATASRWTALGKAHVDRLILWGGLVPPDLDLDVLGGPLRAAQLTLVVGEEDETVPAAAIERAKSRLQEAEIPYEQVSFPGGHRLDRDILAGLAVD